MGEPLWRDPGVPDWTPSRRNWQPPQEVPPQPEEKDRDGESIAVTCAICASVSLAIIVQRLTGEFALAAPFGGLLFGLCGLFYWTFN